MTKHVITEADVACLVNLKIICSNNFQVFLVQFLTLGVGAYDVNASWRSSVDYECRTVKLCYEFSFVVQVNGAIFSNFSWFIFV